MKIIIIIFFISYSLCDPLINANSEALWNTLLSANATTNLTDLQTLDICALEIKGYEYVPKADTFTFAKMQYFGNIKRNSVLGTVYFYGKEKLFGFKSSNVQPIKQIITVKDFFYRLWGARYYVYSTALNWKIATTSSSSKRLRQTIINYNNLGDMASMLNLIYQILFQLSNFTVYNINATASLPDLQCAQLNFIELPTNNTMTYSFCTQTLTFPLKSVLNILYGNQENLGIPIHNLNEPEYLDQLTKKDGQNKEIFI